MYQQVKKDLERRIKLTEQAVDDMPENAGTLGHELYLMRKVLSSLEELMYWEELTL